MIRVLLDRSNIPSLKNYVCCYTATSVDRPALLLGYPEQVGILRIT